MRTGDAVSPPAPGGQTNARWGKRALAAGLLILFLPFLAFTDIGSGVGAINQTCQSAILGSTVQIPTNFNPSALPAGALTLLQPEQQTFASVLSGATGLDASVVSAWMLNEESGAAAALREAANNNDWLNIGYTDTATYGAADMVWSDPTRAAIATAQWLAGKPFIPGYGTSSEGIRAILNTAGSSPQAQIEAIQTSGWASGGEAALPSLYSEITAASSTTLLTSTPVASNGAAQGATSSTSAAETYIQALPNSSQVSYAIVSSNGDVLAQHNPARQVTGAAITTAILLVAYLDKLGTLPIPTTARAHLKAMVDGSSTDADWVLAQAGATEVPTIAGKAGMTSFHLDTTDPSNTRVDALDLARFFARINTLIPATHRRYGMSLLASSSSAERWGILKAGISGITASQGGWDNRGQSTWTVNQAAQIVTGGQTAALAITTTGDASLPAGERVLQNLASAAMNTTLGVADTEAAAVCGELPSNTPLQITQGATATILPDGQATAPANAPAVVTALIAAGNQIAGTAYLYGGAHGTPLNEIQAAYDCSSSTSYALHAAGLFKPDYAYVSGQYETWGKPGPGRWVTIYANSEHVFIEVAGIVLDTSWVANSPSFHVQPNNPSSGPRWQPVQAVADEYAVNPGGFVERHPAGL